LGSLSLGCSVAAEEYDTEEGVGATHAAVRVQHVTLESGEARGDALAGFVQVPAGTDASGVLEVAGLQLKIPEKGECFSDNEPTLAHLASISEAELLEADDVRLETGDGVHVLAPYAFPTVADLLRGVVYLSRDRSAEALPAGQTYTLLGEGIDAGSGSLQLSVTHESPPPLTNVSVEGQALPGELLLPPSPVLDLRWEASESESDVVVVTLESDGDFWACSFSDAEEFGSVPLITDAGAQLGQQGRTAVLGVHRIRSLVSAGDAGVAQISVTFDFAVEGSVLFDAAETASDDDAYDSAADPQ
jgi:hypothetical protein